MLYFHCGGYYMDYNKIGLFLKVLRLSKNMSQYNLAEKMHIDHSKINRIENNKRRPSFEDLIFYSEIFDISLDELIACERKTKQNKKEIQNKYFKYLHNQSSKLKKLRLITIIVLIFIIVNFIGLVFLYFFQNYDTMKVYSFYGTSSNYEINNGLFVLSKEKIYFQTGNIHPKVERIQIFSEINGERQLIYEGDSQVLLRDSYGYNAFASYHDFIKGNQKFFVAIEDEEIPLNFIEETANDNFVYTPKPEIGIPGEIIESSIPEKIKENFECDENSCILNEKDKTLFYNLGIFTVMDENSVSTYDVKTNSFIYENKEENILFVLSNNKVTCEMGNCDIYVEIYEIFEKNYIEKYLKLIYN